MQKGWTGPEDFVYTYLALLLKMSESLWAAHCARITNKQNTTLDISVHVP